MHRCGRLTADAKFRLDDVENGLSDVLVVAQSQPMVVAHEEMDAVGGIERMRGAVEHAVRGSDDPLRMDQCTRTECRRRRSVARTALDANLE